MNQSLLSKKQKTLQRMSSCFKLLSKIDQTTKYVVYGWIREAEVELKLVHIPMMISSICILYYRDDEIFDITGDDIKLSQNKKCITEIGAEYRCNCNYGIIEVSSNSDNVYRWDLKIIKQPQQYWSIFAGLSSVRKLGDIWSLCRENGGASIYMYANLGSIYDANKAHWTMYGQRFRENDTVSIILDLQKQQITYLVNEEDQGIAYKNIIKNDDIKYQLLVVLRNHNDCVEITNFNKIK